VAGWVRPKSGRPNWHANGVQIAQSLRKLKGDGYSARSRDLSPEPPDRALHIVVDILNAQEARQMSAAQSDLPLRLGLMLPTGRLVFEDLTCVSGLPRSCTRRSVLSSSSSGTSRLTARSGSGQAVHLPGRATESLHHLVSPTLRICNVRSREGKATL